MAPKSSSSPTSPKRVLIVDDHPVFRAGLTGLVGMEPDLAVCGEAHDVAQAMEAIARHQPELVIMDMSLPDKSGLEALKDVRAMYPQIPVLMISMHDETLYAERVIRAGGRGYIMKQEGPEKVILAIRKVLSGGISVSDHISALILDSLAGTPGTKPGTASVTKLTDREFEVYRMIGQGKEPQEVAGMLHLSVKTVDTHRAQIKRKLGLKNNTELVYHATRWTAEQG